MTVHSSSSALQMRMGACVRACVHPCVHVRAFVRVCVREYARVRMCMHMTMSFFFFRYCAGQRYIAALSHTGGQARKN